MAAASTDIIKQGYVKLPSKNLKIWKKRWLVLRKTTSSGQARLDKFLDEASAYDTRHGGRTMIELRYVEHTMRVPDNVRKHTVTVIDSLTEFQFSADSDTGANSWLEVIQEAVRECRKSQNSFKVHMLRDTRIRFHGDCSLVVASDQLKLIDTYNEYEIIAWPFSDFRRYGVERGLFQLETGRFSETGEGVFNFSSDDPDAIFECLKESAKRLALSLKKGPRDAPRSQNGKQNEQTGNPVDYRPARSPPPKYTVSQSTTVTESRSEYFPPEYRAVENLNSFQEAEYCGGESNYYSSNPSPRYPPSGRVSSSNPSPRYPPSGRTSSPDPPPRSGGGDSNEESGYDDFIRDKLYGYEGDQPPPEAPPRYTSSDGLRPGGRPPVKLPSMAYSYDKGPSSSYGRKPLPASRSAAQQGSDTEPPVDEDKVYSEVYMDMRGARPFKTT